MPQPVGTGKAGGWCKMNGAKNDGDSGGAPATESRAAKRNARMASALRANLLKRKQQKRDRAAQIKPARDGQD
jgi:hypothetical protein